MEYILLLDAYANQKVAVLNDNRVLCENSSNLPHSDTFMQLIDLTLKQANVTVHDISKIVLNVGPGSFTGIRVAFSIAKGLGFGDDVKYLTYTSFDLLNSKKSEAVLINGFSNFVYIKHGIKMDCVAYESLDKDILYVTNSKIVKEKAEKYGLNVSFREEKSTLEVYKKLSKNELNLNEIEPLYLRKSQAEIQREQRVK